ncbi:sterol desaturase family protein [Roseobacter sinensis]|uniref:Sterol desaturase family protein n=1 Tax=Roseobacter sinensis TaxID=2931391 RepID=A0ABT3BLD9_9RHOB|nr:sterol desaturase family protein [Roseobacter sp. WL0113]MCV3274383.1 sterol desaturase family protein [Roseobacter sp. WL0113]
MMILLYIAELFLFFILFTFVVYWTHRAAHKFAFLWYLHSSHHAQRYKGEFEFSWLNLIGWFNDWRATADQWVTEILPLCVMLYIWPDAWPIAVLYYVDGFVLAEGITDHNPRIDIPGLAMGRYHLKHHQDHSVNYDQYFRLWDTVFGTRRDVV